MSLTYTTTNERADIEAGSQKIPDASETKQEGGDPGRLKELGAGLKQALTDQLNESQYGSFLRKVGWISDNNDSPKIEAEAKMIMQIGECV